MKRFDKDPRQMTAKFNSTCGRCGKKINKGSDFYYFPAGKKALCLTCGEQDYNEFIYSVQDEQFFNNQY